MTNYTTRDPRPVNRDPVRVTPGFSRLGIFFRCNKCGALNDADVYISPDKKFTKQVCACGNESKPKKINKEIRGLMK